jgi:2-polyprenyl-6-methoxyphenol hydroxylase-like FAD-dependent oxidoreductase
VSRPALHRRLVDALPSTVAVRPGSRVDTAEPDRSTVLVDGTPWSFDLLVGADGINSAVRAAMPRPGRVVAVGVACWRALVTPTVDDPPTEYIGVGQRVGVVGLRSGTYLYLVESAAPGTLREVDVAGLRERFAGFGAVRSLLDAISEPPRFDDLAELDRPGWGSSRALLIGDAAHAMTPNLGQGASMAIEDAVVLARRLRDDPRWFEEYVAERDRRVRWVQLTSRRLGSVLHARSAPARWLRDGMLRRTPRWVASRQTERLLAGGPVPALDSPSST